jgi:hypothetical protein
MVGGWEIILRDLLGRPAWWDERSMNRRQKIAIAIGAISILTFDQFLGEKHGDAELPMGLALYVCVYFLRTKKAH